MERDPRTSAAWVAFVAAVVVAAVARFADLDLKPLHSDEAMNGQLIQRLVEELDYRYLAADYHGPLYFFASAPALWLAGATETALRFTTAAAGVASVASLGLFRPWLGPAGVAVAALLLAVAPVEVYFARTSIHEVWLALFTLLGLAGLLHGLRGSRPGILLFFGAIACGAATKENVVISLATVGLGCVAALPPGLRGPPLDGGVAGLRAWAAAHASALRAGAALAAAILLVLFSSFGTYPEGVLEMLRAPAAWTEHAVGGRNQAKGAGYFTRMLVWWVPVLLVAVPGAAFGVWRRQRLAVLCTVWFLSALAVHEALPYKTPWCAVQLGLPLYLLAGLAVQAWPGGASRLGLAALVALGAAEGGRMVFDTSFVRCTDDRVPFVYVQARTPFMRLPSDLWALQGALEARGEPLPRVYGLATRRPVRWYLTSRGWPADQQRYREKLPDNDDGWARVADALREAGVVVVDRRYEQTLLAHTDRFHDAARRVVNHRPARRYVLLVRPELAEHLPPPGGAVPDGGGDPRRMWPSPPPSFVPGLGRFVGPH